MAGVFARLKLRLLANQLRDDNPWRLLLIVIGWMLLLGTGTLVAALMVGLRFAPVDTAGPAVTAVGAAITLAWLLLPLLLGGEDETMDPARFALLPMTRRRLAVGLTTSSLIGAAPLATAGVALAAVVTWTRGPGPLATAVVALPLAVLTGVLASRALAGAVAGVLSGRRGREVLSVVLVLLLSSVGLWPVLIGNAAATVGDGEAEVTLTFLGPVDLAEAAVAVLSWTPLAAAWAAPWAAADGDLVGALGRLAVAIGTLVALWAVVEWSVERRVRPSGSGRATSGARGDRPTKPLGGGLAWLLPDSPTGAVAGRALAYWRRDSRYVLALASIAVVVGVLAVMVVQLGLPGGGMMLGPVVAIMVSLTMVNEFAYDGSAAWVGIATGPRGRADRVGRHLVVLVVAVPLTVAVALVGVAMSGRWEVAPAMVGVSLTLLLVGVAVSAVASVVWTYPVPEAGANPFTTTSGGTVVALLQQGAAALATMVLVLPFLVAGVLAFWWPTVGWAVLVLGPAWGAVCLRFGFDHGGRRLDTRGPELLAALRP